MIKNQESPELTFQMLQSGNIDLSFPIKFGTLLVGKTKAGKTTTSHLLSHQLLEGGLNDQKSVVYKLKEGQRKYANAKIGDRQSVSETQIPNFFDYDNGKKYLVDCPGYLDSYGCYRIISNRFFHYQVFSKVQNMKFIVTFPFSFMDKTADNMKKTFSQFLGSFCNYSQIKQNLINATSVMITTVPRNFDLQAVRQKFKNSPNNVGGQFKQIYPSLKEALLQKNRIFIFPVAQLGESCKTENKILEQIDKVTTYWKRDLNQKQQADMKNIRISITKYMQEDEDEYQKQLTLFTEYYKNSVLKNFQGFIEVINTLTKDNQNYGDSAQFINKILSINKQMKARKTVQSISPLYKKYSEKRDKIKQVLFKSDKNLNQQSSLHTQTDIPFEITKLKAQKKIQKIISGLGTKLMVDRNSVLLEDQMKGIKNVLIILFNLAKQKKFKDAKSEEAKNNDVLDFAYQVYKDIQISNKLFNLIKNNSSTQKKDESIKKLEKGMYFILVQYPEYLKSIYIKSVSKTSTQILYRNFGKIKFDDSLNPKSAQHISKILSQYKNQCQHNDFIQGLNDSSYKHFVSSLDNLIASLIIDGFAGFKKQLNPTLKSLKEMEEQRKDFLNQIKQRRMNAQPFQKLKSQNNRVIQFMAECLCKFSKTDLALQIYDQLYDGHKVLQLLTLKQNKIRTSKKQNQLLTSLIQYMKKAAKYQRKQLAFQKAQQAYHLCINLADDDKLSQVCTFIKDLSNDKYQGSKQYLQHMFDSAPEVQLPLQLSQKILKLATQDLSPVKK